jgi:hypothetical protein
MVIGKSDFGCIGKGGVAFWNQPDVKSMYKFDDVVE